MTLSGNMTLTSDVTLIVSWWGDHLSALREPEKAPGDIIRGHYIFLPF
jgi:hypothetical protein